MSDPPIHPIEVESYRILEERVDLSPWPSGARDVVARVIHATADLEYVSSLRVGDRVVEQARAALGSDQPVICDGYMTRAGISGGRGRCYLDAVPTAPNGSTRAAAAFGHAAAEHPEGGIWVIGNAPTALAALLDLHAGGQVRPGAVIGLPVGFVGATEAKAALWKGPLGPISVTNVGEKGGSAAAASAVNALVRVAAG